MAIVVVEDVFIMMSSSLDPSGQVCRGGIFRIAALPYRLALQPDAMMAKVGKCPAKGRENRRP
jgi:hypothetical protein